MADVSIGTGANDGNYMTTLFNSGLVTLRIGNYSGSARNVFLLFTGVTISSGATIDAAKLTLQAGGTDSATTVNCDIDANDASNPSAPTTYSQCWNATRTSASVSWPGLGSWSAGSDYDTSSLQSIVAELQASYDYSSGSNMLFFLEDDSSSSSANRRVAAYENTSYEEPELHITYTETGGVSVPAIFYSYRRRRTQ